MFPWATEDLVCQNVFEFFGNLFHVVKNLTWSPKFKFCKFLGSFQLKDCSRIIRFGKKINSRPNRCIPAIFVTVGFFKTFLQFSWKPWKQARSTFYYRSHISVNHRHLFIVVKKLHAMIPCSILANTHCLQFDGHLCRTCRIRRYIDSAWISIIII